MNLIERAIGHLHASQSLVGPVPAPLQAGMPANDVAGDNVAREALAGASPPMLGPITISSERLGRLGLIVPGAEAGRKLNEFRVIKRPLIFNLSDRKKPALANAKRIMLTSALPGEGKSYCAINLALSIADERDYSVMLVDADVAKPSVPSMLGIEPRPGLMDALVDPGIDIGQLVSPTSIPNLFLLTSGTANSKATELLASIRMNHLLDRLSKRYPERIIIFDSPPLLVTTEASVLASHMGQIVLVVQAGETRRSSVLAALATLEGAPGIVCTLMNRTPQRGNDLLGYGYGYAYGNDGEARA